MTTRIGKAFAARLFEWVCLLASAGCVGILLVLLGSILWHGWCWLDWGFLTRFASRFPERAGIRAALAGSLWLILLTALISVPLGVGAAIYLEEYLGRSRWKRLIELNIANLAGVPSIVYGILGLGLFVRACRLDRSLLAGALTLSLVVLPMIIIAAQEALRAVPPSIRTASYALGASRWQTVRRQVLPLALPGIMTGVILAIARALGEAAPLIVVGAVGFVAFTPAGVLDPYTALPIQIFNWASRPQAEFQGVAAAGIIVLLLVLICLNGVAVLIRHRFTQRIKS